jgi:hypothetical protein
MNDIYNTSGDYIDYELCYMAIIKHLIHPNKKLYDIDIFCHCWSYDLENEIKFLYKPKKDSFENNENYNEEILNLCSVDTDFSAISKSLSDKKVILLKEEYEKESNITYDGSYTL